MAAPDVPFTQAIALWSLPHLDADPSDYEADEVQAALSAYLALWHPIVLRRCQHPPRAASSYELYSDLPNHLILVPAAAEGYTDPEWEARAAATGATIVSSGQTLREHLQQLSHLLGEPLADDPLARPFFALGLARLWWAIICAHLGREDDLNGERFATLVRQAAANSHPDQQNLPLKEAFAAIDRARSSLYPVELYTLCFVLGTHELSPHAIQPLLHHGLPFNLLITGRDAERLHARHPQLAEQLTALLEANRCELVGGEWTESRHSLLPINSLLWQVERGSRAYRAVFRHQPAAYGRRSFGLASYIPHILNRLNTFYALHYALDGSLFPEQYEPKVRWEGVATSSVEALTRLPLSLNDSRDVLAYARAVAQSIASDHVATTVWALQPSAPSLWTELVAHIAAFGGVFGRWCTVTDYFQTTDPTDVSVHPNEDSYRSAYLARDHAAGHSRPISRYLSPWRDDAALSALSFLELVCRSVQRKPTQHLHGCVDQYHEALGQSPAPLAPTLQRTGIHLRDLILQPDSSTAAAELYLNPGPLPVTITRAARAPAPFGFRPLGHRFALDPTARAHQPAPEPHGIIQVPAFGYRWTRAAKPQGTTTPIRIDDTDPRQLVLQNERYVVTIDRDTGLLRGFARPGDRLPRIGCQLVACGFAAEPTEEGEPEPYTGTPTLSRSRMSTVRLSVEAAGPEFAEVLVEGMLVGEPAPAASLEGLITRYRLAYQCYAEEDLLRVAVEFWDTVEDLWDREESPWVQYLGFRFAWPDPATSLVRGGGALRWRTRQQRFEAPAFIELHDPPRQTVIFTAGLPFSVRSHRRMADLILVTATERARFFEVAIGLDPANSYHTLTSLLCPPLRLDASGQRPRGPDHGWFLHVDARNVHVLCVAPLSDDGRRFRVRLLETAGQSTRTCVRFWRPIASAYLTDFLGEPLFQADHVEDAIEVDILANELVQLDVEVT